MPFDSITTIIRTIREVRLGEIQADAERRFALVMVGDAAQTEALATALSAAPDRVGAHPWIARVAPDDGDGQIGALRREDDTPRLALVVSPAPDLDAELSDAMERAHDAGVPVVTVVMHDGLGAWPDAALARGREGARAVLPARPDGAAIAERLAPALIRVTPEGTDVRLALARQLPVLRRPFIDDLIEDVARANAVYATSTGIAEIAPGLNIPLVAADIIVLTKNQLIMAYKIALMAGKEGKPRDVLGEVTGVIGGGLLFRQIARELVGLIPVVGIVPKVAVAYAGTRVIGHAVEVWALQGRDVGVDELRGLYAETVAAGRSLAESLVARTRGGGTEGGSR